MAHNVPERVIKDIIPPIAIYKFSIFYFINIPYSLQKLLCILRSPL